MIQGRLNELMSQIRMQSQAGLGWGEPAYQMDTHMQAEIKQVITDFMHWLNLTMVSHKPQKL